MLRCAFSLCFALLFFASVVPGVCQGIPYWYAPPFPAKTPCVRSGPPPISRTVQVDVPVPCPPARCGPQLPYRPHPCAPPACAPPPPTRPVRVRIDVRVRPEACGKGQCAAGECRNLGALAPLVELTRRALAAPICILESVCPGIDWCAPVRPLCGPPPFGPRPITRIRYPPTYAPRHQMPMYQTAACGPGLPCGPQKVRPSHGRIAPYLAPCAPFPAESQYPMPGGAR